MFDATSPIKIDRFTINDDHPQRRPLTVPEIFTYLVEHRLGQDRGRWRWAPETQRAFFDKIGFLKPLTTQLTELAAPLYPRHWMTINTMTIAFGHGMSVTPLHLATGAVGHRQWRHALLAELREAHRRQRSRPAHHPGQDLGSMMRQLLRLNVDRGHRQEGRSAGLRGRRQDRHRGKGWRAAAIGKKP